MSKSTKQGAIKPVTVITKNVIAGEIKGQVPKMQNPPPPPPKK